MSIAFKEWEVVCDALASGRQSILLRKGGIHEGRRGFSFAHDSFLLFPTKFHARTPHIRDGSFEPSPEWQPGDLVTITHRAEALRAFTITDWDQLASLRDLHIYSDDTLKDRYFWEGKGMAAGSIHLALVRVFSITPSISFIYEKKHAGCRSWINLDVEKGISRPNSVPSLSQTEFQNVSKRLEAMF